MPGAGLPLAHRLSEQHTSPVRLPQSAYLATDSATMLLLFRLTYRIDRVPRDRLRFS